MLGPEKRWFKIPIQITNYANIVPSHYTVDLAVSYDMGDQPENQYLRNISLQLVVNNVTNKRHSPTRLRHPEAAAQHSGDWWTAGFKGRYR